MSHSRKSSRACGLPVLCCLSLAMVTAQYHVSLKSSPNQPVLSYAVNTSDFIFAFNPSYIAPSAMTSGKAALLVRVQNMKTGNLPATPGRCEASGGSGFKSETPSSLAYALIDKDGTVDKLAANKILLGPGTGSFANETDTQDPRMVFGPDGRYWLYYTAIDPSGGRVQALATASNPLDPSNWTRHGPCFFNNKPSPTPPSPKPSPTPPSPKPSPTPPSPKPSPTPPSPKPSPTPPTPTPPTPTTPTPPPSPGPPQPPGPPPMPAPGQCSALVPGTDLLTHTDPIVGKTLTAQACEYLCKSNSSCSGFTWHDKTTARQFQKCGVILHPNPWKHSRQGSGVVSGVCAHSSGTFVDLATQANRVGQPAVGSLNVGAVQAGVKSGAVLIQEKGPHFMFVYTLRSRNIHVATSIGRDLMRWELTGKVLIEQREGAFDRGLCEPGPPPVRLKDGNLLFLYNSAEIAHDRKYHVGFTILNGSDPSSVIQRSAPDAPLFNYSDHAWQNGNSTTHLCNVPEVVFLTALVPHGDGRTFTVYFGGADAVVGSAVIEVGVPGVA